jgi:RNA 2',3'-cyclic 3'-phosphodiesterase
MDEGIRAFIAIRLSPEIEEAVAAFQAGLRKLDGDISWTRPAGFHLTLKFLGNRVPAADVARMIDGLAPIAAAMPPFLVFARGAGAFPSLKRPRVIWVGLAGGPLLELAEQVEALSVRCGFEPEGRPFNPHLTIGRVRNPSRGLRLRESLQSAGVLDFGCCMIGSIALYRSRLSPQGATYEALATLLLEGAGNER